MKWYFVLVPCNSNSVTLVTTRLMSWSTANSYNDVIMSAMASQITSPMIVYSTVYSGADERWKKSSKLRVIGLCEGNSPVTGEFPTQRTSNVEKVSIWWPHHTTIARSRYGVPCHNLPEFDHNPDDLWHIIVQFWHVMAYREKAYYASPPKRAAQPRRRWDISVENTQVVM